MVAVGFAVVQQIFNLGYHLLPAGNLAEAVGVAGRQMLGGLCKQKFTKKMMGQP